MNIYISEPLYTKIYLNMDKMGQFYQNLREVQEKSLTKIILILSHFYVGIGNLLVKTPCI